MKDNYIKRYWKVIVSIISEIIMICVIFSSNSIEVYFCIFLFWLVAAVWPVAFYVEDDGPFFSILLLNPLSILIIKYLIF